eukprot:scaffold13456_cov115-Isochrysis_galbana.AAC.3
MVSAYSAYKIPGASGAWWLARSLPGSVALGLDRLLALGQRLPHDAIQLRAVLLRPVGLAAGRHGADAGYEERLDDR